MLGLFNNSVLFDKPCLTYKNTCQKYGIHNYVGTVSCETCVAIEMIYSGLKYLKNGSVSCLSICSLLYLLIS